MHAYKLLISYDGTNYCGWQVQPNGVTIQQLLEEKCAIILREKTRIFGSGRTDAGVHAFGQTAHFHTALPVDPFRFLNSLNSLLPPDIRVKTMEPVSTAFHARYSARSKIYHYHLNLNTYNDPFRRLYAWHIRETLDLALLKQAATHFLGTHDFTAFANEAHAGSAAHDAVRTLTRLDVLEENGTVRLEFEGDGFLYKMVRNIVGTLYDVARGKTSLNAIPGILASKDRRLAGQAAPPHGLFLVEVKY